MQSIKYSRTKNHDECLLPKCVHQTEAYTTYPLLASELIGLMLKTFTYVWSFYFTPVSPTGHWYKYLFTNSNAECLRYTRFLRRHISKIIYMVKDRSILTVWWKETKNRLLFLCSHFRNSHRHLSIWTFRSLRDMRWRKGN